MLSTRRWASLPSNRPCSNTTTSDPAALLSARGVLECRRWVEFGGAAGEYRLFVRTGRGAVPLNAVSDRIYRGIYD
jgi:hypothetical protein